jgi:long-chain fatty acid transport protein
MMGRAGAGVAAPCDDGSSMFFNPAALAGEKTVVVSAGITGIAPRGTFTNAATGRVSTLNDDTFPAPTVFAAAPIAGRFALGVGVFAPYGLTTDWPATSEGRFLSYKSSVKSIYVQPTFAARMSDRVMIGGGIDITHTSLELRRRVDLSSQAISGTPLTFAALGVPRGTDFADVSVTGAGTHVGGHIGVLVDATDRVSVGGRYLFHQQVAFDSATFSASQIATGLTLPVALAPTLPAGTPIDRLVAGSFAAGGALSGQTASTSLPLPDQVVVGVAAHATDRLRIMADYQYTRWSMLDEITITTQFAPASVTIENFKDTHGVRVGGDYRLAGRTMLRAGIDAHTAAAPDESVTPLLPEAGRWEAAAGVGVPFAAHVRLDLSYMYVHQQDRNGRTVDNGAAPTVALNNGQFHYYANLFSAGVVVHF